MQISKRDQISDQLPLFPEISGFTGFWYWDFAESHPGDPSANEFLTLLRLWAEDSINRRA